MSSFDDLGAQVARAIRSSTVRAAKTSTTINWNTSANSRWKWKHISLLVAGTTYVTFTVMHVMPSQLYVPNVVFCRSLGPAIMVFFFSFP